MGEIGTRPRNSDAWCAGLWDFGMLNNTQTGQQGTLQLHATVTKSGSVPGIGFHLSAYALGSGGYVLSDWNPENAIARAYYEPTGLGTGLYRGKTTSLHRNLHVIENMAYLPTMRTEAWDYFLTLYPEYKAPVVFKINMDEFPPLGR